MAGAGFENGIPQRGCFVGIHIQFETARTGVTGSGDEYIVDAGKGSFCKGIVLKLFQAYIR